ncbi:hypothetical protein E4T43_08509 [Aureobasidium subglaciale]|nr:hypothetical protein E4T43_08509 [Aureobasidium subglaciale]
MFFNTALLSTLAGLAAAQDLDWDLVNQLSVLSTATVPVVYKTTNAPAATAVTIPYSQSAIIAAISSAISLDPNDGAPLNSNIEKRDATQLTQASSASSTLSSTTLASTLCQAQPTGAGPVPSPDSASAFLLNTDLASVASSAPTPSGYNNVFTNLQKSNSAYGYLGYTTLQKYDTQLCASKCSAMKGCQSFNIYFERDPKVNPNDLSCADPGSTTQIKCVFWGGPVAASNAKNTGETRNQFQVVIAGSNGYVSQTQLTPAGYANGLFLDDFALNAPKDCNGNDTYLQTSVFTNGGPFDPNLCAAACSAQNKYAQKDGPNARLCRFFNTYILYKNGEALGQSCVMYSQSWAPASAKKNSGYYSNGDHFTLGSSFIYSNGTNPGTCTPSSSSSATPSGSVISSSSSSSSSSPSSSMSSTSISSSISPSSSTSTSSSSSTSPSSSSTSSSSSSSITSMSGPTVSLGPVSTNTETGTTATTYTVTPTLILPTTTDINGIKPAATHTLDFAQDNGDETTFFFNANMTVDKKMVNIENFIPFIKQADCSESSIKLTFTSSDALKMAQDTWPPSEFPLMTNDAFCGDGEGSRTFFNVTTVSFDAQTLVASMEVTMAEITQIASTVSTEYGTVTNAGPSGGKVKRVGNDRSTSFTIDSQTFLDAAEQFLWGYELGTKLTTPEMIEDLNPYYSSAMDYTPINYSRDYDQYGYEIKQDRQLVTCPDCGLKATVSLYGGYNWEFSKLGNGHLGMTYVNGGFRITDAELLIAFQVQGKDGYKAAWAKTLAEVQLPGIGIKHLLNINPYVQLNAHLNFEINGGTITIGNLGIGHKQDLLSLDFDFLNNKASQSGWLQAAPEFLTPVIQYMPTDVKFSGSIGPAFGIEIDALTFSSKAAIGLETPLVEVDVTPRDKSKSTSSCVQAIKANVDDQIPLDITLSVGVGIYATLDIDNDIFGSLYSGDISLYQKTFPVASTCLLMYGDEVDNKSADPGFV